MIPGVLKEARPDRVPAQRPDRPARNARHRLQAPLARARRPPAAAAGGAHPRHLRAAEDLPRADRPHGQDRPRIPGSGRWRERHVGAHLDQAGRHQLRDRAAHQPRRRRSRHRRHRPAQPLPQPRRQPALIRLAHGRRCRAFRPRHVRRPGEDVQRHLRRLRRRGPGQGAARPRHADQGLPGQAHPSLRRQPHRRLPGLHHQVARRDQPPRSRPLQDQARQRHLRHRRPAQRPDHPARRRRNPPARPHRPPSHAAEPARLPRQDPAEHPQHRPLQLHREERRVRPRPRDHDRPPPDRGRPFRPLRRQQPRTPARPRPDRHPEPHHRRHRHAHDQLHQRPVPARPANRSGDHPQPGRAVAPARRDRARPLPRRQPRPGTAAPRARRPRAPPHRAPHRRAHRATSNRCRPNTNWPARRSRPTSPSRSASSRSPTPSPRNARSSRAS